MLLELHGERRKKPFLACSKGLRIQESYSEGPGSFYIGEGPGGTKWWEPGWRLASRGCPAEPGRLVQPDDRLLRSFGGQLGPMMTASSGDDPFLYGLIVLSLDDVLGQLGNKVETTSCFCYWL